MKNKTKLKFRIFFDISILIIMLIYLGLSINNSSMKVYSDLLIETNNSKIDYMPNIQEKNFWFHSTMLQINSALLGLILIALPFIYKKDNDIISNRISETIIIILSLLLAINISSSIRGLLLISIKDILRYLKSVFLIESIILSLYVVLITTILDVEGRLFDLLHKNKNK